MSKPRPRAGAFLLDETPRKGSAKEKWGKLTDDDLTLIEGRREQLEGRLQERYGKAKDQVRQDVDDWLKSLH